MDDTSKKEEEIHPPTLVLLKDQHFKPLHELVDEIIEHAFDYYMGNSTYAAEALQMSRNTLHRKGFRGSRHRALGKSRPPRRKSHHDHEDPL